MNTPQTIQRAAAQQRAADPARSSWVTANAGAGKTLVLVDRVIRLLLAGTPPQRILCLTFTRAAAAEMANRLLDRLGRWSLLKDDALTAVLRDLGLRQSGTVALANARQLFAAALETPGGLKIQTIHAFCEAVLKRFPLEAGVPPHFDVLDERAADMLYREAIARTLEEAARGDNHVLRDACHLLARRLGENRLEGMIKQACTHRYFTTLSAQNCHAATRWLLNLRPDETETSIRIAACDEAAFDKKGLLWAAAALATGSTTDCSRAKQLDIWLAQPLLERAGMGWDSYLETFLTQKGKAQDRLATKAVKTEYPAIETILKTEQERLITVHERLKTVRVAESSTALTLFAARVLENYTAGKKGRLDFDDLITRTQALLDQDHGASWVMYKIDGGIDHILVDEAQDTAPGQWAVIRALSDEFFSGMGNRHPDQRSIFTVGDEKQSIYRFQGADPEYSLRVRNELAAQLKASGNQWSDMSLGINFRSAPALLEVVDWVFAERAQEYGFSNQWVPHRANRRDAGGLVEWWALSQGSDDRAADPWSPPSDQALLTSTKQLVEDIADHIEAMIARGERLATTGRPIQAGDILILIQKRTGKVAEYLAHALKRRGVPVAGNDRLALAQHLAVMDLCAAARFALYPDDDLNLAAVLKGPFCTPDQGLDEDDLMQLCLDRLDHDQSLWATLKRQAPQKTAWKTCYQRLSAWLREADQAAPYDFFNARLVTENGRRALLTRQGPEAEEPIDEFLTLCLVYETKYAPSLQSFLHWFEHSAGTISRRTDSPRNEVRIMTVHSAKGLEAPVVFLADTARIIPNNNEVLWARPDTNRSTNNQKTDHHPILLWSSNKNDNDALCTILRTQRAQADLHEYYRLLYVAMTRAQDRLYVCGWEDRRSHHSKNWHAMVGNVLREKGVKIDHGDGKIAYRYETGSSVVGASCPFPEQSKVTPPEWLYRPAPQETPITSPLTPSTELSPTKLTQPRQATRILSKSESSDIARQRGLFTHHLLEIIPSMTKTARRPKARLMAENFIPSLPAETTDKVVEDVLNLLEDPSFAHLFTSDCLTEVPISGVINGIAIKGRIDRLKVTHQDVTILDYKSGSVPKQMPTDVPAADLTQMALYRSLCQRIYPKRPIRCVLLWTNGPQLWIVPPATLDKVLPAAL